jgi:hypothetical protein
MPLMPVPLNCGISYFDGPPVVGCAAFAMHKGKMTEAFGRLCASVLKYGARNRFQESNGYAPSDNASDSALEFIPCPKK